MVAPFSKFYDKTWVSYCLKHWKTPFLLKNDTRDFQNSLPFDRSECFYVTASENFEHFQYFNFEIHFLENENFLRKLKGRFLVERTKVERTKTSFP